jgi:catechol 2,3-dioxygenase-like lactoylglutathione lyase family enzyme
MTIDAVRPDHAVLFVRDLELSLRLWTEAFGRELAATEPRAKAALLPLPRSGNHHDLGLSSGSAEASA